MSVLHSMVQHYLYRSASGLLEQQRFRDFTERLIKDRLSAPCYLLVSASADPVTFIFGFHLLATGETVPKLVLHCRQYSPLLLPHNREWVEELSKVCYEVTGIVLLTVICESEGLTIEYDPRLGRIVNV